MKIFNRKTEQSSNDYYEAYKVELATEAEENKLFSLNNFLKLEIIAVAVGFIMMNQNSLTSEFKKFTDGNDILPVSMQYAGLDKELVITQEDNKNLEKISIREDDTVLTNTLDQEAFVNNTDIQLLLELLKSKMKDKQESPSNRIIISQN